MRKYLRILFISMLLIFIGSKMNTYASDITITPTCRVSLNSGRTLTNVTFNSDGEAVVKINMPENGRLHVNVTNQQSASILFFKDKELQERVIPYLGMAKGTYYCYILSLDNKNKTSKVESYYFPYKKTASLNSKNKWTSGCTYYTDSKGYIYTDYKFTVKKNSYVDLITQFEDTGLQISLYNSQKKLIRSYTVLESNKHQFIPVSEGTYYLRLGALEYAYKASVKTVSIPTNRSKKKAKKYTLGKTINLFTYARDSKTYYQWYKFTLTKAKKLKSTSGMLIFDEKGKGYYFSPGSGKYYETQKLKKGTYYFKTEPYYTAYDIKNKQADHYKIYIK